MKLLAILLGVFTLLSPDGKIKIEINVADRLTWSASADGQEILSPSQMSMTLDDGTVLGLNPKVRKTVRTSVDETISSDLYKKSSFRNRCNQLTLRLADCDVIFRAYDNGVAYRFTKDSKKDFKVVSELAEFNFAEDWNAYNAYVSNRAADIDGQFYSSQESLYTYAKLSDLKKDKISFPPLLVEAGDFNVCVTESDLRNYPGMYFLGTGSSKITNIQPRYPDNIEQGGHNMLQGIVRTRKGYIASRAKGANEFPWRLVVIEKEAKDLTNCDLVYALAKPAADTDWSWVKPGKVAWDWWNDWNITGVDFKSGVNNRTYEYYIDFAAANGIQYVILDEGWSVNLAADLTKVIPEIDIKHICDYAASKGVNIILWAGYWAFDRDIEAVCKLYSAMGVKGFKIDFMDRDDQAMVEFYESAASTAAKYHMMCDFHGAYKPTGLNRTYPNIINYEGVHGLENVKFSRDDQVEYDVTIPFIRMLAGPMDYTQGAMRNATRRGFYMSNSEPMSQGTRCRQLAEYVIFDAPLTMLCDSPSAYMKEPECTSFIAAVPTTWDRTVAVDGKVADYVAMAREKDGVWYVGALTDWSGRDLVLDLSFLPEGSWKMSEFKDGVNAERNATDYATGESVVRSGDSVTIHMAPGGGWVAKLVRE